MDKKRPVSTDETAESSETKKPKSEPTEAAAAFKKPLPPATTAAAVAKPKKTALEEVREVSVATKRALKRTRTNFGHLDGRKNEGEEESKRLLATRGRSPSEKSIAVSCTPLF